MSTQAAPNAGTSALGTGYEIGLLTVYLQGVD